ncbi:heparan-sulfate lyase [Mucilaginibacter yixingensis]|uniref:Heparan-sulfate lyase n=1 Tax=Mucilaginibacter yixingensis TaxID=1295612 RepID=A0A2T5J608_9SPHI|nr:heparin-sulfate lyase HepC [Mucilaginibacter yixingensis]PTQ93977.1 heparan-sulfate lyase [Mucilaginibacter yixingensis]
MMRKLIYSLIVICALPFMAGAQAKLITTTDKAALFARLDLKRPGLEAAGKLAAQGDYDNAAVALLKYYRQRTNATIPDYSTDDRATYAGKKLPKGVQEKADKGMQHLFFVHTGYDYFDYGKDINWQNWPVKDNEVRWQLHRMYWWEPMGLAYWSSGDEKYAKEWMLQYEDWIKKNPLGLSADNDRYAWRPLEVSERLESQLNLFIMFINSPNFTPQFLVEFLNNYANHADYLSGHYSEQGNHLLFESQRIIDAGCFFPEFSNADKWRKGGIENLNREIKKQIYPDGLQFELSPNYHVSMINVFLKALRATQLTGLENEFPQSYKNTTEQMIMALANFSFPDYVYPMFADSKLVYKNEMVKNYQKWVQVFPKNEMIHYLATEGKEGHLPAYLSYPLKTGGFYTFRNGWDMNSTVMVLRAGPRGEFHAQPDNGTFDLWVKGRDFTPDAGSYVYSGDASIMKLRNWYRQSMVHKTLTLNNQNMETCDAKLKYWKTSPSLDVLQYENQSYPELKHRRTVLFVNKTYFVILDDAIGAAKGNVGIHFQLAEGNAVTDATHTSIRTDFNDNNNLLIQTFGPAIKTVAEDGKVSYSYREEKPRPAVVFEQQKTNNNTTSFATVLYPYASGKPPVISLTKGADFDLDKGKIDLTIKINNKEEHLVTQLSN